MYSEGVVADVRELPFDDGTFDVALDKGSNTFSIPVPSFRHPFPGTMDAMMTTKGDVWVAMVDPTFTLFLKSTRFRTPQSR